MNTDQIDFFMKNGYVIINQVISCNLCENILNYSKKYLNKNNIENINHIKIPNIIKLDLHNNKKFMNLLNYLVDNKISNKQKYDLQSGYFISKYSDKNIDTNEKWHIDGITEYKSLNQELAYTCVFSFTDIEQESGTFIAPDSIKLISNLLNDYKESIHPELFFEFGLLSNYIYERCKKNIIQLKLKKGDLLVMHPFLLHSKCTNLSKNNPLRIISNFHLQIKDGMKLDGNSLVEKFTKSILNNNNNIEIKNKKYNTQFYIHSRSKEEDKIFYFKYIKPTLKKLFKLNIIIEKKNNLYWSNNYTNIEDEDIIDNLNIDLYEKYRKTWMKH